MSAAVATALRIDSVRFRYRGRDAPALDDVSLEVPAGQAVALLGPNGSGKSTLLSIIAGTRRAASGTVELFGRTADPAARARLGAVFQRPALDPHLTVTANLVWQGRLYGLAPDDARQRAAALLREASLEDRAGDRVGTLSGGLARRVDLCRALLHEPDLLLLDEPTTGLDPSARRAFLVELRHRADRGLTMLLTTHLTDEAEACDRVVLLERGRIVADGAPEALRRELGAVVVTVTDTAWSPPSTEAWEQSGAGWQRRFAGPDDPEVAVTAAALAAAGVACAVAPPSLDDVFEHHTGARLEPAREAA